MDINRSGIKKHCGPCISGIVICVIWVPFKLFFTAGFRFSVCPINYILVMDDITLIFKGGKLPPVKLNRFAGS
jgi:hypothetical protein